MGRLAGFRYRQVVKRLGKLGFVYERPAKGSHEMWRRTTTGRTTTILSHAGDIAEGTMQNILSQGGVSVDEFLAAK